MRIAAFKLVLAALVGALIATLDVTLMLGSARAQTAPAGFGGKNHDHTQNGKADPPKPKVDDKAYNSALKSLPDKQYDAWHGMR